MFASLVSQLPGTGRILAEGLVNILDNMFQTTRSIVVAVVVIVGMVFVVMTWMRTRSLVPTIGSMVLSALIAMGVNSFGGLANRVGDDLERFDEGGSEDEIDTEIDERLGDGGNDDGGGGGN